VARVREVVADRVPGLPTVVGALNDLSEPTTGLRGINSIRIHRRSLHVIDFPSAKMRTTNIPFLALAIGGQHERSLSCAN
jgi:hypothetical protein